MQTCEHKNTTIEQLDPNSGSQHYARLRCADCHCHIAYLPKPKNIALREQNAMRVRRLLNDPSLTHFERSFIKGINLRFRPTPDHQALLDTLWHERDNRKVDNNKNEGKRNGALRYECAA
jgi:hypothetical protein